MDLSLAIKKTKTMKNKVNPALSNNIKQNILSIIQNNEWNIFRSVG